MPPPRPFLLILLALFTCFAQPAKAEDYFPPPDKEGGWRTLAVAKVMEVAGIDPAKLEQAFVYASLAVAPLMVVTPILQLSLVFRLFLSRWFNRDYEVFNIAVMIGAAAAVVGSILVSLNSDFTVAALGLPDAVGDVLKFRLAGR